MDDKRREEIREAFDRLRTEDRHHLAVQSALGRLCLKVLPELLDDNKEKESQLAEERERVKEAYRFIAWAKDFLPLREVRSGGRVEYQGFTIAKHPMVKEAVKTTLAALQGEEENDG